MDWIHCLMDWTNKVLNILIWSLKAHVFFCFTSLFQTPDKTFQRRQIKCLIFSWKRSISSISISMNSTFGCNDTTAESILSSFIIVEAMIRIFQFWSICFGSLTEELPFLITWNIIPTKINLVRDHCTMFNIVEVIRCAALPKLSRLQFLSIVDPDPNSFLNCYKWIFFLFWEYIIDRAVNVTTERLS